MKLASLAVGFCALMISVALPMEAGVIQNIKEFLWGKEQVAPPAIKVLIAHDRDKVAVEVRGKYKLYDPNTQDHISSRFLSKGQYFQAISGGLKWGEEFPGLHQLLIVPDESGAIFVDGRPYKGNLYVYDVAGSISLVNELSIEDFLAASLKYRESQADEALAAIAIAARTQAYYAAAHPKTKFWAVDGAEVQYEGAGGPHAATPIEKAIYVTRFMVMSKTSAYERITTSFPALWATPLPGQIFSNSKEEVLAKISLEDAITLAERGENAAQILIKAFPGTVIAITYP